MSKLWGVPFVVAFVLGCTETRRPLGEDCLKDQDCLSGVCSGLRCAAAPTLIEAGPTPDAGNDAPGDAPADVQADSGPADAAAQG
jgi:hypothetical protein